MESGLGVIDLGGEWYKLQESRYSLCRSRQGDARHDGEQREMAEKCACDRRGLARLLV